MNTDDNNITTMHSAVEKYMLENSAKWNLIKAIADAVKTLSANNAIIADKRGVQEQAMEGETSLKKAMKKALVDNVHVIADQLHAYAQKMEDAVLIDQTHVSTTGLNALADELLIEKAEEIQGLATKNKAALIDYNIADADLTALDDAIKAFDEVKDVPTVARAKRVGATRTLPGAIHGNQKLLAEQLDKMMSGFRLKDPPFYVGYLAARVIIDRRAHRKTEEPTPTPTPTPTP